MFELQDIRGIGYHNPKMSKDVQRCPKMSNVQSLLTLQHRSPRLPYLGGLVTALAFDGSPDIHLVTKGAVALADLGQPLNLGRRPCFCHGCW